MTPITNDWLDTIKADDTYHGDWYRWNIVSNLGGDFCITIFRHNYAQPLSDPSLSWEFWINGVPLKEVNTREHLQELFQLFKVNLTEGE